MTAKMRRRTRHPREGAAFAISASPVIYAPCFATAAIAAVGWLPQS
jgi:hypothetical protein